MKLLIIGASGRLGKAISELAQTDKTIEITSKIGSLDPDISPYLNSSEMIIDVSTPAALKENLPKIINAKKPLVIGSTGHNEREKAQITLAAKSIPILLVSNFSPGIACIKKLLPHLPEGHFQITETHHKQKKDSPSGTSLDLAAHLPQDTHITSIRKDDIFGEHTITVTLPFETISITHTAHSRDLFAFGALKACKFLLNKPCGLYTSFDER